MNAKQAKLIPLQDYLFTLGIKPVKVLSNSLWYYSPLRSESTPSFKVNTSINCWHDFGSGERGNIIGSSEILCDDLIVEREKS